MSNKKIFRPERFAPILARITSFWSKSLDYQCVNNTPFYNLIKAKKTFISAIWHGELFPYCYLHRNEGHVAVVSQSEDGEWLAKTLEQFGFLTLRGSSSKGGARVLVRARKLLADVKGSFVFAVDGPRGPRCEVKPGVIYLAKACNLPILPVRVHMSSKKILHKAWDKFQIPYPFSKCIVNYGVPYMVVQDLNEITMLEEQNKLKNILNSLGQ